MRNKLNLILLIIFLSTFCFSQTELTELQKVYEQKSIEQYEQFLKKWEKESKPISINSLKGLHKDVYQIFQDFYDPFNLAKIGTGERGRNLYSKVEYVIVQNSIDIAIHKTDELPYYIYDKAKPTMLSKERIDNFRPELKLGKPILFLLPKYDTIINKFLGSEKYPLGPGVIMNPGGAEGESEKRSNFLNQKLKIIYGHWGGYWHIETHPQVLRIDFNENKTIAKVHYRLGYEGGAALYKKQDSKWKMQEFQLIWIE